MDATNSLDSSPQVLQIQEESQILPTHDSDPSKPQSTEVPHHEPFHSPESNPNVKVVPSETSQDTIRDSLQSEPPNDSCILPLENQEKSELSLGATNSTKTLSSQTPQEVPDTSNPQDETLPVEESTKQVPQDSGETIPPNRTLYVNNLNTKIKLPQLKKDLEGIFSNFGVVRQIVAMSSFWRRGQAWIVFSQQESANKALVQLQGFPYAGKEMRIQYAREISDIFTKEMGTYVKRPSGPKKPRAIIEREKKLQSELQQFQQIVLQRMHQEQRLGDNATQPLSQPLQEASAIAAQVQQVMQQPSLLAMFPNAALARNNTLQTAHKPQQPCSLSNPNLYKPFTPIPGLQMYPSGSPGLPMPGANGFQSLSLGRPHHGGQNMVMPHHQPRQDKMMMMPNQPYMMKNVPTMARGISNMVGMPQDLKAPAPSQPMSKDAVVAAAAAAAAAAINAAKKRVNDNANLITPTPRPTLRGGVIPPNTYTLNPGGFSQPLPSGMNNPAMSTAPSTATADHSNFTTYSQHNNIPDQNYSIGTTIPNRTLCVEGLPEDCTMKSLEIVFKQHVGCGEIRHISSQCVAFIDFDSVTQSATALARFQNFPIKEGYNLRISYARQ